MIGGIPVAKPDVPDRVGATDAVCGGCVGVPEFVPGGGGAPDALVEVGGGWFDAGGGAFCAVCRGAADGGVPNRPS